jgi:hypothetical protein
MKFAGVDFKLRPLEGEPADLAQFERELYAELETEFPVLWRACYPRIYHDPRSGQYASSKKPARQIMLIALKIINGKIGPSEQYEYHLASHLTKFRVPTYWLSPSIAEALRLTEFPGKFDWYNMPMPFEAGVFMMPQGSLRHKSDGDIPFICYARFRAGEEHYAPLLPKKPYVSVNGGMMMAALLPTGYFVHWNIPLDAYGPVTTMPELKDMLLNFNTQHGTALPVRGGTMTPDDFSLGLDVAHYIFSALMLMTARPELVTAPSLAQRVPAKKGRQAREFWNPAIIGEHYKLRHAPGPSQGGTHASPRFHWVEGFWKEQPYGPGRNLRKTIWIEPYMRGLDDTFKPL